MQPADAGGCGCYRLIWPAESMDNDDVQVKNPDPSLSLEEHNLTGTFTRDAQGVEHVMKLDKIPDFDVFVFQRPLQTHVPEAMRLLRQAGRRVVCELDDDFTSVHAQNVSWRTVNGWDPSRSKDNILRGLAVADVVTVSTPALAKVYGPYCRRPPIVIPNYVPRWYTDVTNEPLEGRPDALLLGWSGSLNTHPQDLSAVGGAAARLLRENNGGVELAIVGTGQGAARAFGTKGVNGQIWVTGWVPIDRYPVNMAQIDVGMVPLKVDQFNQGKSWLKGVEFASVGVPFVASPTDQYLDLMRMGIGSVAFNARDWYRQLKRLVIDEERRRDVAASARLKVYERLVMDDHLDEWMDAWVTAKS